MSRSWQNLLKSELGLTSKVYRIRQAKKVKSNRRVKKGKKVESYGYDRMLAKNRMIGVEE